MLAPVDSEVVLSQPRKFWARWRVRVGYLVAAIYWLLALPTPFSILIGGLIAALGLLIRGLASGHLRKDETLATTGPYGATRNPLYFGSAFLAAGFVVAGHSWMAGTIVTAYFAVFYYAVMRSEERDVRERFGAAFDEYASRVPLFVPRFPPWASKTEARRPGNRFSWPQYRRNREYQALLGTLAGLAAVWLRMWLRALFGY
jgi:protein-S-isoprenylcysteine O-methyltransferase Ste14